MARSPLFMSSRIGSSKLGGRVYVPVSMSVVGPLLGLVVIVMAVSWLWEHL